MKNRVISFFIQSILSYKSMFSYIDPKIFILVKIIKPSFRMLFFCYLAKFVYDSADMTPWVIGNAFMVCIYGVFTGAGLIMFMERGIGTLPIIMGTPTNRFTIFLTRAWIHMVDASVSIIIMLLVGSLVFKVDFSGVNYWLFGAIILIAMYAAISMGMVVSSMGLLVRDINMIINVGILAFIGLSGANIPVENLPLFLQKLSVLLPVTRSIEAGRLLVSQADTTLIYQLMIEELMVGCIYMFVGYLLYRWFDLLARKHASLDMY